MKTIPTQLYNDQKGFVLLFTIVVTAIIFFIGAGIYSLSFKELLVSSLSKESQKSIFAADSGVECALWANINDIRASESFLCMGQETNSFSSNGSFTIAFPDDKTCARVTILQENTIGSDPDAEPIVTTNIISQGYNKCRSDFPDRPATEYSGLAERVYKVRY